MYKRNCMLAAAVMFLGTASTLSAESVTLFRVFLNDGTAVVSYGEFARVGDRVVFSMPLEALRPGHRDPNLHVVNLPASAVNWTATTKYADSARLSHYMSTAAESDYTALAGEVAATLNAIVLTKDAKARLRMAVDARRRLASWPRDHYGYRAGDVREMLGLLDEAIAGLRAAAGETSFALDLVASTGTSSPAVQLDEREKVPMLRVPSATEAFEHAMAVAKATDSPAERVSILRGVVAGLDRSKKEIPAGWAAPVRKRALEAIRDEASIGNRYARLSTDVLARAAGAAAKADVRSVELALEMVARRDAQLGRRRPDEINALLDQVRVQLDAARKLRLARDQWRERAGEYRAYMKLVSPTLDGLARARSHLGDIKSLVGSDPAVLVSLAGRFAASVKTLSVMKVPEELKPAHALLTSAANLAETAVKTRRQAALSGQLSLAWDASSAAAGSMMLLARAREDMEAAIRFPQIR